ncbi:MAG: hypothetical protein CME69_02465 [Halobacteriovorax sp.]|nr:hypothetical protein [Halobacteriovorax sp.]
MKIFILLLISKLVSADYLVMVKNENHPFMNALDSKEAILEKPYPTFIVKEKPAFKSSNDFIVEENQETYLLEKPLLNDEKYPLQWALDNRGNNEPRRGGGTIPIPGVVGSDIGIKEVWGSLNFNKKIVVAVVDTGVDHLHVDLKNQMWINKLEASGSDGIDDDGNGFVDDINGVDLFNNDGDPMDDNMHGTHVSGIIGAEHNNVGIAGVNNNVSIMAVKYMDHKGRGNLAGAIKATKYAVENGARVVNNSWGMLKESKILREYLAFAGKEHGVIFVAAAGNNYKNLDISPLYPAAYRLDNQITVAALNPENRMTGFSCYGKETVHTSAPGRNIISTVPGNDYKVLSGTSMSAPYVAGAVSLLLSKNPSLTPLEIKEKVINTSVYVDHFKGRTVSEGRLNIRNLLEL